MTKKWSAWKRRQRSLVRYALVPTSPRITAAGLQSQTRVVELRSSAMF